MLSITNHNKYLRIKPYITWGYISTNTDTIKLCLSLVLWHLCIGIKLSRSICVPGKLALQWFHMGIIASQPNHNSAVCSTDSYDQPKKHQNSISLPFVMGIHGTNGQQCGKHFLVVRSSWCVCHQSVMGSRHQRLTLYVLNISVVT